MSKDKTRLKILNLNKMKYPRIICPQKYFHPYTKYVLVKKINQSKFIYKCGHCKRNFIVIIKSPLMICKECNNIYNYDGGIFAENSCSICGGTGVLTWIENVFGKDSEIFDFSHIRVLKPPYKIDSISMIYSTGV